MGVIQTSMRMTLYKPSRSFLNIFVNSTLILLGESNTLAFHFCLCCTEVKCQNLLYSSLWTSYKEEELFLLRPLLLITLCRGLEFKFDHVRVDIIFPYKEGHRHLSYK